MHESSLAKGILDAILARAHGEKAQRVRAARGWVADDEAIDPESLAFHFRAHAAGTIAQDAKLELARIRVPVQCNSCDEEYEAEHHVRICPHCGSTDGELRGRCGLSIEAIDIDG